MYEITLTNMPVLKLVGGGEIVENKRTLLIIQDS